MQPAAFEPLPGRYLASRSTPPYRHVPGVTPHPRTSRDGHSYGAPEPRSGPLIAGDWHGHPAYLFGVDLYNRAYWWEAHEWWEATWRASEDEEARHLLQGLIQLAAALLKWHAGNTRGRRGLWRRGRVNLLESAAAGEHLCGLDPHELATRTDTFFARYPIRPVAPPARYPAPPVICLATTPGCH